MDDARARIDGAGDDTHSDASYHYDNWRRSPDRPFCFVVQRTVAGAGWIRSGTRRHDVPAGTAMLFTHDERSSYGYPEGSTDRYHIHWVAITGVWLEQFYRDVRASLGPVVRMAEGGEAAEQLAAIVQGFFRGRLTTAQEVMVAGTRLLAALEEEARRAEGDLDPVNHARMLAERDFATGVNLKQLAQRVGVSREHLTREFTLRFGESPGKFLRRLRLERASSLLRSSRTTAVSDVAAACGFGSPQAFTRAFRASYGRSPEQARTPR